MKIFITLLITALGLTTFQVSAETSEFLCTTQYDPVCGVDGKTYSNSCMASKVAIAHVGECSNLKPVEKVVDLSNCLSYYDGCNNCQVVNGQITGCTKRACIRHDTPKCLEYLKPQVACTMDYNPVCGVDGQTYGNRCAAEKSAQVAVAYEGECQVRSDGSTDVINRLKAEIVQLQTKIAKLEDENKRLQALNCAVPELIKEVDDRFSARFKKVYQRSARADNLQDQRALQIMQSGMDFKAIKRDLKKESEAIRVFQKSYGINATNHRSKGWDSQEFWNLIHAIAYSGVQR